MALCAHAGELQLLDDFTSIDSWHAAPADGVQMNLVEGSGTRGNGLQFEFDFQGFGGWASAVRPLDLTLPDNFALEFDIRGSGPANRLEIKLIDDTGENVWWKTYQQFEFPNQWTRLRLKRRHFRFAWGPNPERPLKKISAIEITIAAGSGGKGTTWIDELAVEPLEKDRPYDLKPHIRSSSSIGADKLAAILQDTHIDGWRSDPTDTKAWLELDFIRRREFGGLILEWDDRDFATDYQISFSNDGRLWTKAYRVRSGNGGRDYLPMPESDTRFLKLDVLKSSRNGSVGLLHIDVCPLEFGESDNSVFQRIAKDAIPGEYPKYFTGKQSYWTVVGVDRAREEALINEQGMIELDKGSFSVEPFLKLGDKLQTWHGVDCHASLEEDYLPIPCVTWRSLPVELKVTALAYGKREDSNLRVRYLLTNQSDEPQDGALFLALRPFQVNPPWQFLGTPGGVARIHRIDSENAVVTVNGEKKIATVPEAERHFLTTFDEGGAVASLRNGTGEGRNSLSDPSGLAAGVLYFPFNLAVGARQSIYLLAPFQCDPNSPVGDESTPSFEELLEATSAEWQAKLGEVEIKLPPSQMRIARTLKTTLAYTLINCDGFGIQPGSRAYERSWIRDGALTSVALLRLGQSEIVRDFLRWYSHFQFDSGRVPCCVDQRGADSVPENDSHGQLIFAIAEYHRFTHDNELLRELWPNVQAAVEYIRQLRQERMTEEYQSADNRAFYGLMPGSISHEGYSAKPMHSYWDDFFVLRGLKDAVYVAHQLEEKAAERQYAELRDEFRRDLLASLRATMENHDIDYLPGCVELGDFDATSSTIIVTPCEEDDSVSHAALERTFDRYWSEFVARRDGSRPWDDYTPYEWRVVGALVRMGQKQRAYEALNFFFLHQRPPQWNHWAEVVYRDPDTGKFIGDMPHTWVGSGFIRSLLDMFAFDREEDQSLVVGAGIPEEWLSEPGGLGIRGLHTFEGKLDLEWKAEDRRVRVRLGGTATVPPGGIHVYSPKSRPCTSATVDGETAELVAGDHVIARKLPIVVDFKY